MGEGSIISGRNPLTVDPTNPLPLFIVQMVIIVVTTRLLSIPLAYIKQPRVIAEVIGGIILGPSVLGQIPGFRDTIFPSASLPFLNIMANFGLVLYLFIVGLELDLSVLAKRLRYSLSISVCGMGLSFSIGAAISFLLYNSLTDKTTQFGSFLLFTGVSFTVTAFPVLARILTEKKLLTTPVGSIVIASAAVDDVVSWILLALTVSIANSSSNWSTAIYILLCTLGWALLLLFAVRPLFILFLRRCNAFENGPSPFVTSITLILCLVSAFYTEIIGVHPIFGGFLVGIIMPHEGGFALAITEKLEDLVNLLFLPLYFTLSGLKTQIGLLNDGISWGFVILVILGATTGKVTACTLAARANRLSWRESFTIGCLMNTKGLVELIVLNLGLDAGVINGRIFAILVLMAIVTTCMTSPLVSWLYSPEHQRRIEQGRDEKQKERLGLAVPSDREPAATLAGSEEKLQIVVCLKQDMHHIPALMSLIRLLGERAMPSTPPSQPPATQRLDLRLGVLRIMELTQRTSSILMISDSAEVANHDPVLNVFRAFGSLQGLPVQGAVSVLEPHDYASNAAEHAERLYADLLLVPWGGVGAMADLHQVAELKNQLQGPRFLTHTPPQHLQFVANLFLKATCSVGLLVDRGFGRGSFHRSRAQVNQEDGTKLLLPFFGGPDDREALLLVVKLCADVGVSATVIRMRKGTKTVQSMDKLSVPDADAKPPLDRRPSACSVASVTSSVSLGSMPDPANPQASEEDDKLLEEWFGSGAAEAKRSKYPQLERVHFFELNTSTPIRTVVQRARGLSPRDLVVVGRAFRQEIKEEADGDGAGPLKGEEEDVVVAASDKEEPDQGHQSRSRPKRQGSALSIRSLREQSDQVARKESLREHRRVLGVVAQNLLNADISASLLVVQAGKESKKQV
ncbi:uncharacterized protein VTP21DRAFT_10727 [Calcarisporiella thermophila]|uniref:uncharacterized protein n=1 Tax=Calcarisporiella thermophila TaxID=911321 RepID=UPI0037445B10